MLSRGLHATLIGIGVLVFGMVAPASGAILEQKTPVPTIYTEGVDYDVMDYSAVTDVTALLFPVDVASVTSGCEAADFAGFPAGSIALMKRGTCTFQLKALNASAAGAVGALIFNNGQGLFSGTLISPSTIPVFGLTDTLGQQLAVSTAGVTMHMNGTPTIPEPASFVLVGLGLAALVASRSHKRR